MATKTAGEPANMPDPFTALSFDIASAAALGAEAKGVEIATLKKPADLIGVPDEIPVALLRGEDPSVGDLSDLFDKYRLFPRRKTGTATAQTFEAFAELVNRHKTEHSVIFANMDWKKPSFTAVIDYHHKANGGQADFGKHRVHYAFPLSDEWQKWIEHNGQMMKQGEFAYFLEDRIAELSAPTEEERVLYEGPFNTKIALPTHVMELSRGLKVNIDTKVKNATTLQSGEGQVQWEEVHNGEDGKPLKVPGLFILNIAPFFMGEKVRIPVRLRYRPSGPQLLWQYEIYRPDTYITEHVRATLFDAKAKTELPAYEGTPEMAA